MELPNGKPAAHSLSGIAPFRHPERRKKLYVRERLICIMAAESKDLGAAEYEIMTMPEGLLIAGFPRIVSLPLEGKVPRRGG